MLIRFRQIDYNREMALLATMTDDDGKESQIVIARYVGNPDGESVEFALAVGDDWPLAIITSGRQYSLFDH